MNKFGIKEILLCLFVLLTTSAVKAQKPQSAPTLPIATDDEFVCGLRTPEIVQFDVSVWSGKKGYLKGLTYKDFEVYDEKEFQEIEFFKFDELKNRYTIGFRQKDFVKDAKWHNITVRLKLSKEKDKNYGKILVAAQKGYYPKQN